MLYEGYNIMMTKSLVTDTVLNTIKIVVLLSRQKINLPRPYRIPPRSCHLKRDPDNINENNSKGI